MNKFSNLKRIGDEEDQTHGSTDFQDPGRETKG